MFFETENEIANFIHLSIKLLCKIIECLGVQVKVTTTTTPTICMLGYGLYFGLQIVWWHRLLFISITNTICQKTCVEI